MKIRTGFVSNSSSASFVIMGFAVDNKTPVDTVKKLFELSDEDIKNKMKESNYYEKYPEEIDNTESIEDFCYEMLLDVETEELGYDCLYGEGSIPEGKMIIGKMLTYIKSEDSYANHMEATVDELIVEVKAIQDKMENTEPIKIYAGSMCC